MRDEFLTETHPHCLLPLLEVDSGAPVWRKHSSVVPSTVFEQWNELSLFVALSFLLNFACRDSLMLLHDVTEPGALKEYCVTSDLCNRRRSC